MRDQATVPDSLGAKYRKHCDSVPKRPPSPSKPPDQPCFISRCPSMAGRVFTSTEIATQAFSRDSIAARFLSSLFALRREKRRQRAIVWLQPSSLSRPLTAILSSSHSKRCSRCHRARSVCLGRFRPTRIESLCRATKQQPWLC